MHTSGKMRMIALLLIYTALLGTELSQGVDLTLVPEANGITVVQACLYKISGSNVFTNDNQMLRRIAYVETRDGADSDTYPPNYHGGIWQLSQSKFLATQNTGSNIQLQQHVNNISTAFGINWTSAQWVDLRKPFYSALAARLYFLLIPVSIPLGTNISGQASYWGNYYTSNGNITDFTNAVNTLQAEEGVLY